MSRRCLDTSSRSAAEVWTELGTVDPYWAVLTRSPGRRGGWLSQLNTFYTTGEEDVEACAQMTPGADFTRVLDYGSGTGRLSLALARHATEVSCVDVSATMHERLRLEAAQRGVTNLRFLDPWQAPVSGHTWAISLLTLQHLPGRASLRAALEYIRDSLVPGGCGVVEVPSAPVSLLARLNLLLHPQWRIYRLARFLGVPSSWLIRNRIHGIYLQAVAADEMQLMLEQCGLRVVQVRETTLKHYSFVRYSFERMAGPSE